MITSERKLKHEILSVPPGMKPIAARNSKDCKGGTVLLVYAFTPDIRAMSDSTHVDIFLRGSVGPIGDSL